MKDNLRLRRCPEHAPAKPTVLDAWACPQECDHFIAELNMRIEDMTVSGNFHRLVPGKSLGGRLVFQEYRQGIPYGTPRPSGPPRRTPFLTWLRSMYRARRR